MKGKRPHQQGSAAKDQPSKKKDNVNWKCLNCNFPNNFPRNTACFKCEKPRSAPGGSFQQVQTQEQPKQGPNRPQQQQRQQRAPHAAAESSRNQLRSQPNPQQSNQNRPGSQQQFCAPQGAPAPFPSQQKAQNCPHQDQARPQSQAAAAFPQQNRPQNHPGQQQQPLKQSQGRPQSQQSSKSLTSSMQSLKISPSKSSRHSSRFMIESSTDPTEYEGEKGEICMLEVNYGKISFDPKKLPKEAFHYDVTFDPETPKKFLPFALAEFMRVCFKDFIYASDNRKNVYTALRLQYQGTEIDEQGFQHKITARMGDRTKDFIVKVKYAGSKDMSILMSYTDPINQNEDKPMDAIQALDVILRKPFHNVAGTIQVSRALYFAPREHKPLGDGMELWYGL